MVFFLDRTGSRQAFATLSVAAMICLWVVMVTGSSGCVQWTFAFSPTVIFSRLDVASSLIL